MAIERGSGFQSVIKRMGEETRKQKKGKPYEFGSNKMKAERKERKRLKKIERRNARNNGVTYQEIGNH